MRCTHAIRFAYQTNGVSWEGAICHLTIRDCPRRTDAEFDRWLQANAIFGSIFAAVLIAMAFAGSRSIALHDAAVASGTTTAFEVGASEQHRTRTEVVTTHGPPIRLKAFGQ